MTREEFIQKLDELGAVYTAASGDLKVDDTVYIVDKDAYTKKNKHPRKYSDLFVPYLRVSHFDGYFPYVRFCGWRDHMSWGYIMAKVKELTH